MMFDILVSPSISRFSYRFTPHWMMCVLAVCGIALFSWLGTWQLHRAEQKKALLAHEAALKAKPPRPWAGDDGVLPEAFERVKVQGVFLQDVFFLDNQYHNHQLGYHVISPLKMPTGELILVDRGWVPATSTRKELPKIHTPKGEVGLSGSIYQVRGTPWVLGAGLEPRHAHQTILEALDFKLISQFLHKPVYPFIIRLDNESMAGYVRDWVTVVMPPERHLGYAVQWFALASVVLIVFVGLNLKRTERMIRYETK